MSTTSLTSLKVGDPESPAFADFGHFPPFFFEHPGNIHSWNRDPGGCCWKTAFLPFFFGFLCDVTADAIFDWGLPTLADEKARSGCKNFCENLCGSPLGRHFPAFVCGIGALEQGACVENPTPSESFLFFWNKFQDWWASAVCQCLRETAKVLHIIETHSLYPFSTWMEPCGTSRQLRGLKTQENQFFSLK